MNPYPAKHSVLIMDNARIHHDDDLVVAVKDIGGRVLYLPPYSPDLNPIETAFLAMKSWLKRYRDFANYFDPKYLHQFIYKINKNIIFVYVNYKIKHLYINN